MPCDYSKYPDNWKQIRAAILDRANNCCEFCGVENYAFGIRDKHGTFEQIDEGSADDRSLDGEKVIKIVLTVAHMNHDITDSRSENLRALCQRCHLTYDAKHHSKNASHTREMKRTHKNQGVLF